MVKYAVFIVLALVLMALTVGLAQIFEETKKPGVAWKTIVCGLGALAAAHYAGTLL